MEHPGLYFLVLSALMVMYLSRGRVLEPGGKARALIPRTIYQTSAGGPGAASAELRAMNPSFAYRHYTDAEAEAWVRAHCDAEVLGAYRSINPAYGPCRADLFRYLLMYAEGGVYLDIKSGTALPLERFLRPDDAYLLSNWCEGACGRANWDALVGTGFGEYQQWWIACAPRHPFLRAVIRACLANIAAYAHDPTDPWTYGKRGVLLLTGPIAYTRAIRPIARDHASRFAPSSFDGAFVYSRAAHEHAAHYSTLTAPIVLR